ncbi:MAG: hypothetical protein ACOX2O_05425 [Bdellovibrionota bacterium]|jgi:hypothetical protein
MKKERMMKVKTVVFLLSLILLLLIGVPNFFNFTSNAADDLISSDLKRSDAALLPATLPFDLTTKKGGEVIKCTNFSETLDATVSITVIGAKNEVTTEDISIKSASEEVFDIRQIAGFKKKIKRSKYGIIDFNSQDKDVSCEIISYDYQYRDILKDVYSTRSVGRDDILSGESYIIASPHIYKKPLALKTLVIHNTASEPLNLNITGYSNVGKKILGKDNVSIPPYGRYALRVRNSAHATYHLTPNVTEGAATPQYVAYLRVTSNARESAPYQKVHFIKPSKTFEESALFPAKGVLVVSNISSAPTLFNYEVYTKGLKVYEGTEWVLPYAQRYLDLKKQLKKLDKPTIKLIPENQFRPKVCDSEGKCVTSMQRGLLVVNQYDSVKRNPYQVFDNRYYNGTSLFATFDNTLKEKTTLQIVNSNPKDAEVSLLINQGGDYKKHIYTLGGNSTLTVALRKLVKKNTLGYILFSSDKAITVYVRSFYKGGSSREYFATPLENLDSDFVSDSRFRDNTLQESFNFSSAVTYSKLPVTCFKYAGFKDSDGDGLCDHEEVAIGSNPRKTDTDNDGISDGEELYHYFSSPLLKDSDNDGYSDAEEIEAGTRPYDANVFPEREFGDLTIRFDSTGQVMKTRPPISYALNSAHTWPGNTFKSSDWEYPSITALIPFFAHSKATTTSHVELYNKIARGEPITYGVVDMRKSETARKKFSRDDLAELAQMYIEAYLGMIRDVIKNASCEVKEDLGGIKETPSQDEDALLQGDRVPEGAPDIFIRLIDQECDGEHWYTATSYVDPFTRELTLWRVGIEPASKTEYTLAHELGHKFGLIDLYQTGIRDVFPRSIMKSDSYCMTGFDVLNIYIRSIMQLTNFQLSYSDIIQDHLHSCTTDAIPDGVKIVYEYDGKVQETPCFKKEEIIIISPLSGEIFEYEWCVYNELRSVERSKIGSERIKEVERLKIFPATIVSPMCDPKDIECNNKHVKCRQEFFNTYIKCVVYKGEQLQAWLDFYLAYMDLTICKIKDCPSSSDYMDVARCDIKYCEEEFGKKLNAHQNLVKKMGTVDCNVCEKDTCKASGKEYEYVKPWGKPCVCRNSRCEEGKFVIRSPNKDGRYICCDHSDDQYCKTGRGILCCPASKSCIEDFIEQEKVCCDNPFTDPLGENTICCDGAKDQKRKLCKCGSEYQVLSSDTEEGYLCCEDKNAVECSGKCCSGTCANGVCCEEDEISCGGVCCAKDRCAHSPVQSKCCPSGTKLCGDLCCDFCGSSSGLDNFVCVRCPEGQITCAEKCCKPEDCYGDPDPSAGVDGVGTPYCHNNCGEEEFECPNSERCCSIYKECCDNKEEKGCCPKCAREDVFVGRKDDKRKTPICCPKIKPYYKGDNIKGSPVCCDKDEINCGGVCCAPNLCTRGKWGYACCPATTFTGEEQIACGKECCEKKYCENGICKMPTTTSTVTATPPDTPNATESPTKAPKPNQTSTPDETTTPTSSETVMPTPSETPPPAATKTPLRTVTPTVVPSKTVAPSNAPTPTITKSATPTMTPTKTATPTKTPTPSRTPTKTPTKTPTPTPTITPTVTSTLSPTPTCPTGIDFNEISQSCCSKDLPYYISKEEPNIGMCCKLATDTLCGSYEVQCCASGQCTSGDLGDQTCCAATTSSGKKQIACGSVCCEETYCKSGVCKTPTPTPTKTPTKTPTPSVTKTPTNTPTKTPTPSVTKTPTKTPTPTPTPKLTPIPTVTKSPIKTPTPTPSATFNPFFTESVTPTPLPTPFYTETTGTPMQSPNF